jgi:hypothetical protein
MIRLFDHGSHSFHPVILSIPNFFAWTPAYAGVTEFFSMRARRQRVVIPM